MEINKNSLGTKHNIVVGCIYRPPYFSLALFNELLSNLLGQLQSENKFIYLLGDFNCNTMSNNMSIRVTEEFKNIFLSNFLFPLINKPTRITHNTATCIDNIYCNFPNGKESCNTGILTTDISDHLGIFCINNSINLHKERQSLKKRSFSIKNITTFKKSLLHETWDFISHYDVHNSFTRFQGVIDLHFKHIFPEQTFTMTYQNRHPWKTHALRTQICKKITCIK